MDTRDLPGTVGAFPIVGVGASAGGLEAFTQLLKHLPLDTGMAFVLVQHLDPDHESALTQLLSRATQLSVTEITHNQQVEPNHVYIIPRDTNLSIEGGMLKLQPRPKTRAPHRPIDSFFESLSQDQHEMAIGMVLSGTATDGTLGLEAIKAEGGITFAQDDSARHDSMPRSAVAAGCVDLVLSPAEMAAELSRISKHPYIVGQPLESSTVARHEVTAAARSGPRTVKTTKASRPVKKSRITPQRGKAGHGSSAASGSDNRYNKILLLLHKHSGVDFSLYKATTIQRRINRRMILSRHETLADYARFLRNNPTELDTLFSDVLISVTSFFRNPEMFGALKRTVLPELLRHPGDGPLRCWVLGCSTGQEAYSIAMAFVEATDAAPHPRKLQIFATDLNDALLDKARHGLYARSLAEEITPERLRRFFVEEDGGYRVTKPLREMVVFARQNFVADPAFSRMDIISCRNVLIYLEPSLQNKALPTFHYALRPGGYLLLGASESIGGFTDLFEVVDKKNKIFLKKAVAAPAFHLPVARMEQGVSSSRAHKETRKAKSPELPELLRGELHAQREADRITVNQLAPPGVLVNAELQVLQFRGPTGEYLEPPTGKASFDILKMARHGLMLPLRRLISQAIEENRTVRKEHVRFKHEGASRTVNLEVIPLKNVRERCLLILFEPEHKAGRGLGRAASGQRPSGVHLTKKQEQDRIAELEAELSETREYLQSMQEQHEAANEELQAASEEVQSSNEELQSLNEELETSKEELESANEELSTVNEEMSSRNAELNRLNNDLVNLQTSTGLAIILLGHDLTIHRFSPRAQAQFDLRGTDVGRPVSHIRHGISHVGEVGAADQGDPVDLERIVLDVISNRREQELEVRDRTGFWFSLRVHPYLTSENKVDGAVLLLVDIDSLKRGEEGIAAARDYAESIIATVREPLLVIDHDLNVESANRSYYQAFQVTPGDTIGKHVYDLGNRQWDVPNLREQLAEILKAGTTVEDFEIEADFETIGHRIVLLNARRLVDPLRKSERILLAIEDITARRRAEETLLQSEALSRLSEERFRTLADNISQFAWTSDADGQIYWYNQRWYDYTGTTFGDMKGWGWKKVHHPDHLDRVVKRLQHSWDSGELWEDTFPLLGKDGSYRWFLSRAVPIRDEDGKVVRWFGTNTDVTEQRRMEDELRRSAAELAEADRRKNEFLATLAHELRNPLAPIRNGLEIMRLTPENPKATQVASEMMERQVRQMVRLVDDLLDVSRISRGRIELHAEPVELVTIVETAVEAARTISDAKGIELEVVLPRQPIVVRADATRLAQVLGNLLHNACKFTDRGGRIELAVERQKGEAVVRVRDNGIGIATGQLSRIFDMFVQVDASLERSGGGLGIGLTLVKDLVQQHGGTVQARSAGVGLGSEFEVRLPIVARPRTPTEEQRVGESATVTPRRILVVDDNLDSAISLAMLLELSGHDTRTAHDGLEAIEAVASFRPDVVLFDIGLPKLNGFEAARRIREEPWGQDVVLVALTGWGQREDLERSKEAGFDYHLVKPVEYAAITGLLASLPVASIE